MHVMHGIELGSQHEQTTNKIRNKNRLFHTLISVD